MAEEIIYIGVSKDREEPEIFNHFTRTEAIERMAKALYDLDKVRCSSDECPNEGPTCEGCPIWEKYEKMAKAALDALLEVNRNE